MKYIIFLITVSIFAVDAQKWKDQFGFGRGDSRLEFQSRDTGANEKSRKFLEATPMDGMEMDQRPNPLFPERLHQRPKRSDDFFKSFGSFGDMFSQYSRRRSSNTAKGEFIGSASGNDIVFGEGAARSSGKSGSRGFGVGRGVSGSGTVFGHGQGFGMGFD